MSDVAEVLADDSFSHTEYSCDISHAPSVEHVHVGGDERFAGGCDLDRDATMSSADVCENVPKHR